MSIRKWIMILAGVFLFCFAVLCIAAGLKYNSQKKNPPACQVVQEPHFIPDQTIPLGEKRVCRVVFSAPWCAVPGDVDVTAGDGLQLAAEPVFTQDYFHWGETRWTLDLEMLAYRLGEIKSGTLYVSFAVPGKEVQEFSLPIPAVTGKEVTAAEDDEIRLADLMNVPEKSRVWLYVIAGLVLLLVIVLCLFLFRKFRRKQQQQKQKTLWETALESIQFLREHLAGGLVTPEKAVTTLTDVVRRFLEQRYQIRAQRQTTTEFFRELDKHDSLLPESDRKFLRHFLETADMIKFARAGADMGVFEQAANRAEKLVRESMPSGKGGRQ